MNTETILTGGLALLQAALPSLSKLVGDSKTTFIGKAVEFITEAAPLVAKQYQGLKPITQNIIMALKSDPSTHMAQLDALEEAEKILDKDFDDAADAALAEDAAAAKPQT